LKYFNQSLLYNDKSNWAKSQVSWCQYKLENQTAALKTLQAFDHNDVEIFDTLGFRYFSFKMLDKAKSYYQKYIEKSSATRSDFMNFAHILWCLDQKEEALEYYKKSLSKWDWDSFYRDMEIDFEHLENNGVSRFEFDQLLETLKKFNSNLKEKNK